jgi:hypothetical protein
MIGFDMIKRISERLYKNTGLTPNDVQVEIYLLYQLIKFFKGY